MTKQDKTSFETVPAAPGWYRSMLYPDMNRLIDEPAHHRELTALP